MKTLASVTVKNKIYPYTLEKKKKGTIHIICKESKINQEFLPEDISELILDLPNLIIAEQQYKRKQDEVIRFRVSGKEKSEIEKRAIKNGYTSVSQFLRDKVLK